MTAKWKNIPHCWRNTYLIVDKAINVIRNEDVPDGLWHQIGVWVAVSVAQEQNHYQEESIKHDVANHAHHLDVTETFFACLQEVFLAGRGLRAGQVPRSLQGKKAGE